MCLSGITQIIYGIVMCGSAILTATALFTPSWNTVQDNAQHITSANWTGLMPWSCTYSTSDLCKDWWGNLPGWMKAVVVCMVLALLVEILAIVWNVVACLACCCKKYIIHPLTLWALIATVLLLVSVIVYAANWGQAGKGVDTSSQLGYSFWLAVIALVLAAADVIIGALTVCLGENCC